MISIGDSDWDESDDELIVTRVSNGTVQAEGHTEAAPEGRGHTAAAAEVTAEDRADIIADTEDFFTFEDLQTATKKGNLNVIIQIMESDEYDVNAQLTSGWTLLMYAVEEGHHEIAEFYLMRGADVNYHCQMFYPLMSCFLKQHLPQENVYKCVKLLLDHHVLVNVHDKYHVSPLMMCAQQGYTLALDLLCKGNVDINKQNQRGWTALCYAAERNRRDSIDVLLKHGASAYITSFDEQLTCADIAHNCGYQQLYEYLEKIINPASATFKAARESDKENTEPSCHKMGEIEMFLTSVELGNLIPLFAEQKIDFTMLLNMNCKDLERVGVFQVGTQQKILTSIKSLHASEWEMPDQSQSLYNLELNCRDSSKVMKVYTKHLKYLTATSQYLLTQFKESKKLEKEYATNAVEDSGLIDHYQHVYRVSAALRDNIEEMGEVLAAQIGTEILEPGEEEAGGSSAGVVGSFVVGLGLGVVAAVVLARNPGWWKL